MGTKLFLNPNHILVRHQDSSTHSLLSRLPILFTILMGANLYSTCSKSHVEIFYLWYNLGKFKHHTSKAPRQLCISSFLLHKPDTLYYPIPHAYSLKKSPEYSRTYESCQYYFSVFLFCWKSGCYSTGNILFCN